MDGVDGERALGREKEKERERGQITLRDYICSGLGTYVRRTYLYLRAQIIKRGMWGKPLSKKRRKLSGFVGRIAVQGDLKKMPVFFIP